MHKLFLAPVILLLFVSCVTPPPSDRGMYDSITWAAPPLNRAISVREGRTDKVLAFDALLDSLAEADVVFLGETHTDETTHRVELAVYQGLLSRRSGGVVLAMEMFERDIQQHLDAYLAGDIDEAALLANARPWANYRTAYRPLIERAKASGRPVIASNFPRPLWRRVAMEGSAALEVLEGKEKRHAPAELFPNTEAYWRRVDNAVRSHRGMMGGGNRNDQRLYSPQTLWDNAMGEACATALDEHPGDLVLHVNGGFHSAYWDGAVRQLRLRKPESLVKTVSIVPVANPTVAELEGAPSSDYVIFAEARAVDLHDGAWSVYVGRELKYRFFLPEGATSQAPVPLLIWLSDDGLTAADGMDLWKDRLGGEAAIAVLEAPYRETQEDLSPGGGWYWPDTFSSDIDSLQTAVERVWGYLLRHYPIDRTRVCLAGEGTGATVAAAVALLTNRMSIRAVALSPRRYVKIKEFPLPLPELRGDNPSPEKFLRVFVGKDDESWWIPELREYAEIGFDSEMVVATHDPWERDLKAENALRSALELEVRPSVTATTRRHILVTGDSPRARHWARLWALRYTAEEQVPVAVLEAPPVDSTSSLISITVRPESASGEHALPLCPGPFGGTTVVVLSEDATEHDLETWLAIQDDDPLKKRGRFHRLRIATPDGERKLSDVLSKLLSNNLKNVLIVPATFCAEAVTMRGLRRRVREFENRMTLHWLPGLGGMKVNSEPTL